MPRVYASPDFKRAFGARLRALRQAKGLTQEDLAHRAGLVAGNVFRLEGGYREPYLSTVMSLASALGVRVEDLCAEIPGNSCAPS
jgi:transcriptional regulator with XRE-family HTH domain